MVNREYLITFRKKNGLYDYEWFDTEEEMRDYIKRKRGKIEITDTIRVVEMEHIQFEEV
jgi:hypothetical protein